jgi:hypothetical protein
MDVLKNGRIRRYRQTRLAGTCRKGGRRTGAEAGSLVYAQRKKRFW